jgi:hypothetical protein
MISPPAELLRAPIRKWVRKGTHGARSVNGDSIRHIEKVS